MRLDGGDIVFEAPTDRSLLWTTWLGQPALMVCIDLQIEHAPGPDDQTIQLAARGPENGVSLNLDMADGELVLVAIEPTANRRVDDAPVTGSGARRFRMVVYYDGSHAFGHLVDRDSGATEQLRGAYLGEALPAEVYLAAYQLVSEVRIERLIAGQPHDGLLPILTAD